MVWIAVVMCSHGTHLIRADQKTEFLLFINPYVLTALLILKWNERSKWPNPMKNKNFHSNLILNHWTVLFWSSANLSVDLYPWFFGSFLPLKLWHISRSNTGLHCVFCCSKQSLPWKYTPFFLKRRGRRLLFIYLCIHSFSGPCLIQYF